MLSSTLNKDWKITFFDGFSKKTDYTSDSEQLDKLKFEHFPPVVAKFYDGDSTLDLDKICNGKLTLKKAKLSKNYNWDIITVDYKDILKTQLNRLMQQQIDKLKQEDPTFIQEDEEKLIEEADFPFIKLMTLVYSKDTKDMSQEDQITWKSQVNDFINRQIIFSLVNSFFTMKLYQDNLYTVTLQTPYNKEHTWNKYANNMNGLCVTYDFKEITENNALHLSRLFPVVYSENKLSADDFDYEIYNYYSANLVKVDDNITQEDNGWEYIYSYKYNEKEYSILDRLLQPVYEKTMNYDKLQEILNNDYVTFENNILSYDHEKIISDVINVLNSSNLNDLIKEDLENVYDITDNTLEIDFLKPEGIYLGINFSDNKIDDYNDIAIQNNVKIFKIKEGNGMLYKSLI